MADTDTETVPPRQIWKLPDMQLVTNTASGNIARIGYDMPNHTLYVTFLGSKTWAYGYTYRYFGVPRWVFTQLLESKSIGHDFDELVKKTAYRYERMEPQSADLTLVNFRVIYNHTVVGIIAIGGVSLHHDYVEVALNNQGTMSTFSPTRESNVSDQVQREHWRLDIVTYYVTAQGELIMPCGVGDQIPMPSSILERFIVVRDEQILARLPNYQNTFVQRVPNVERVRL